MSCFYSQYSKTFAEYEYKLKNGGQDLNFTVIVKTLNKKIVVLSLQLDPSQNSLLVKFCRKNLLTAKSKLSDTEIV